MTGPAQQPGEIDASARTVALAGDRPRLDVGPADARVGTILKDSYRLERRLGAGGMGEVYLAEHVTIHKKVAIKILGPEHAGRPELKERFLREARAAAAIDDERVIAIHDFGDTPDGSVFFAMEYLQGEDLEHLLARQGPLPWPRARDIALQICGALASAHARGVVHRDMKPANVFRLDRPDRDVIKVLDFGIAKLLGPEVEAGQGLTRTGMLFGTPEYMSPEQAQGVPHDHRVDIYALGVIVFEMLTGAPPFRADTFMALVGKHIYEAPPRPSEVAPRADIPAAAEAVVLKALQKDPDLRFQSMAEMAAALTAADAGVAPVVVPEKHRTAPPRGTPTGYREPAPRGVAPWIVAVGTAVLVAVTIAGVAIYRSAQAPTPAVVAAPPPVVLPPPPIPAPAEARPAPPRKTAQPAGRSLRDLPAPPDPATTITLRLDTGGVAATVFDERGAPLGRSDAPGGLPLPRGADERRFTLRAPGHADLEIRVTPDRDRTVPAKLSASPEAPPDPQPAPSEHPPLPEPPSLHTPDPAPGE